MKFLLFLLFFYEERNITQMTDLAIKKINSLLYSKLFLKFKFKNECLKMIH